MEKPKILAEFVMPLGNTCKYMFPGKKRPKCFS